jgi:putative Holliday junction resolvase
MIPTGARPGGGAENAPSGRILAVDLGDKRVGLALSDPLRIISSPHSTISMTSETRIASEIQAFCREKEVTLVVIGLPVSADGSEGPGCQRARRIAERLGTAGLPTVLQDESWTSRDAEAVVRETGGTRRRSRDRIDAVAASFILREYLSGVSRP